MEWEPTGSHIREHTGTTDAQKCPACGSTEILSDSSMGLVCTNCSTIIDEQFIVNTTAFTKQSDGSSKLNGQLVNEFSGAFTGINNASGLRLSTGKEGRMRTLRLNKEFMQDLCEGLKLVSKSESLIETAFRMFTLLQQRHFLKGRLATNVAAACLYTSCRLSKVPRTLTDFSEVTRVNSLQLGKVFTDIKLLLRLTIPPLNAEMLIDRYASELDFGVKEKEVAQTAKLITLRLKKDFIDAGRRPEGCCGAALIIAARFHGFSRTIEEVMEIVKVSKHTVTKRLKEFGRTASSNLTAKSFFSGRKIDDLEAGKPPVLEIQDREKQELLKDREEKRDSEGSLERDNGDGISKVYNEIEKVLINALEKAESEINDKEINKLRKRRLSQEEDNLINLDFEEEEINLEQRKLNELALVPISNDLVNYSVQEDELSDYDFDNDEEVENAILTDDQAKIKTAIWMNANKDYLEKEKARKALERIELQSRGYKRQKIRKTRQLIEDNEEVDKHIEKLEGSKGSTLSEIAAHTVYKTLKKENKSDKIDYEMWKKTFAIKVDNFPKS